ncbi:hypothetical protein BGC07_01350 [Piscirickettsia litoralis]|uniref:Uncharacterized protein n=2 Tax=Piscirickettsia litoralis TaxID=1891921 RepID=A0ABX2ZZB6_9GAMM|nr:hypothetical protein BGC07_01350 [Piscirickettsia litoralis]
MSKKFNVLFLISILSVVTINVVFFMEQGLSASPTPTNVSTLESCSSNVFKVSGQKTTSGYHDIKMSETLSMADISYAIFIGTMLYFLLQLRRFTIVDAIFKPPQ